MSILERLRKSTRGEPLRAALYARFSSDNQRNESIDAQIRAIKEFAHANDIVIVAEYIDRAKSATTDDRPDFQRMIKDSAKGDFQLLIVHKLDRFARNRNDSIAYRMKLQRNHITLLSVLEPFDEDRPETVLLQSVIEGMNEFYSKNLSREVKKGLKENALKCVHTGGIPPLGYDVDKETRRLVVN
ncbi:MAG: recombinase family protein, partial [Schwartzia sp.]|nr:recombinase family protein [Schwartzia sp. (in: firmicutes)]